MKNRILKTLLILLVIFTMTFANFAFVGKGLISYAADNSSTNHQNIEFEAYFKDENNNKVTKLKKENIQEETFLYLNLNVKREGYFNGEISLENSNFTLKEADSEYVSKIENNTIYLNQINVGAAGEIKVKIEPIKENYFNTGLLSIVSRINLNGIYRDSTQKDINIKATKQVTFEIAENNTEEDILNEMTVITNKIMNIDGQDKRVVQFSYNLGLKENNYPIEEIKATITIPSIDNKNAEDIASICYFNNMTAFRFDYEKNNLTLTLKNSPNNENKVRWKSEGSENIVITCIYDKEVNVENTEFEFTQEMSLYDGKKLETSGKVTVSAEELDNIIQMNSQNTEESIYKGKLNSGIARQYQNKTELKINYAPAISHIELTEKASKFVLENQEVKANVTFDKTTVKKSDIEKIFGQDGSITIYDQNGTTLGTITSASEADLQGNINISYEGKNVTQIMIRATNPIKEGRLEIINTKTIQDSRDIAPNASELKNNVKVQYNSQNESQEKEISMKLEDTIIKTKLELSREDLSTAISNNIEIKAVLLSNNEQYDLFTNPQIAIQLPEQVENITINDVYFLYEDELKIKNYTVDGKTIYINTEGTQTQYHEGVVEGSTIIINATITTNPKVPTSDAEIRMICMNGEKTEAVSQSIKIVAPKDLTTVYNIQGLGIETLGQEETKQIMMEKSSNSKELEVQIEIINNNQNSIENVKILGDLPTNSEVNNMGIQIINGITVQNNSNAKVYYSENSKATDDIENTENGWKETIAENSKVCKFLIIVSNIESQNSLQASYKIMVPANLEYNQVAKTGYTIKSTDSRNRCRKSTIFYCN